MDTFGTRSFWPLVAPWSDEPDAGAMPAAGPRRHVGHGAVMCTVRRLDNWITAEVKIRAPRVTTRPAAGSRGERADLLRGGQVLISEGDCLVGGPFRRRLDEEGSGRLRFGAAVRPGGDRNGGLLDLGNRNHPGGQEVKHDVDSAGDAAVAGLPAPDAPRADAKQLGDAALCNAEYAECRAELIRGRGALVSPPEVFSKAGRCSLPSQVARLDEDRHRSVPDLESRSRSGHIGPPVRSTKIEPRCWGAPRLLETDGAEQGDGEAEKFDVLS